MRRGGVHATSPLSCLIAEKKELGKLRIPLSTSMLALASGTDGGGLQLLSEVTQHRAVGAGGGIERNTKVPPRAAQVHDVVSAAKPRRCRAPTCGVGLTHTLVCRGRAARTALGAPCVVGFS